MTTAIAPISHSDPTQANNNTRTQRSIVTVGLAAGAAASAANVIIAATALGLGVSLKVGGSGTTAQPVPVAGFATMTLLGTIIGIVMAAGAARWAEKPARRFVTLCVVGVAVSLVPSILGAADGPTLAVLFVTHLTAAAIVVTTLARRLRDPGRN